MMPWDETRRMFRDDYGREWHGLIDTCIISARLTLTGVAADKLEKRSSTSSLIAHCEQPTGIAYQNELRLEREVGSRTI